MTTPAQNPMQTAISGPAPPLPLSIGVFAGMLGVAFGFATLASAAPSGDESAWFTALNKPPIFPPSIVFPLVWTPLYLLMPIALFLVWRRTGFTAAFVAPAGLWLAQLVLNAGWTWLFFAAERPWIALTEIAVLWGVILAMILAFWRVRPLSGALMIPYLAWVSFAAVLNAWFALIN
jgi:translocator protein